MLDGDDGEGGAMAAESYNSVAKWFHWVTVGLMAVALPLGFLIKYIKDSDKMPFYAVHESAGLTILLVAIARLAWRWSHPPPPLPDSVPPMMRTAAGVNHWLLYAALILQPILGFTATNAQGFPLRGETAYLGFIDLPKFMEANKALADPVQSAHTVLGISIAVLLAIHIAAAIFHQAIRRDGTLLRIV
ncbi:MAG: cytochrome b [Acetobacteraceae bacterium]|nr:cytochrome b [Acetobacteraceae bacterium]